VWLESAKRRECFKIDTQIHNYEYSYLTPHKLKIILTYFKIYTIEASVPPHAGLYSHITHKTQMFSALTLLGGLSDTGDSTPSSVDKGLFDNTLVGEDPVKAKQ
jgi:hypothetical protein